MLKSIRRKMPAQPLACSVGTYVYSYEPSHAVQWCHNIPHVDSSLQTVSQSFNESASSPAEYIATVVGLPAVIMVLGILSVVILQVSMCCRFCFTCCTCGPKTFNKNQPDFQSKVVKRRKLLFTLFYVFSLLTILADQAVFFGNAQFDSGVEETQNSFSGLATISNGMIIEGNLVSANIVSVSDSFATTSCGGNSSVTDNFDSLADSVDSFTDILDPLPKMFTDINADLEKNAIENKNQVVFIFYAFILALAVLFMLCPLFEFKTILKFVIVISEVVVIALTVMCCIEMVIATVLADYCMEPTENLLSILPKGDIRDLLRYYTQCVGDNILTDPLTDIKEVLWDMQVQMTYLYENTDSPCYNEAPLVTVNNSLIALGTNIDNIACLVSCDEIAPLWVGAINDGFCTDFFTGYATIWIQQFVTAGLLYALCCTASVLYEFFGDWWNVTEGSIVPIDSSEGGENKRLHNDGDDAEAAGGGHGGHDDGGYHKVRAAPMDGHAEQHQYVEMAVVVQSHGHGRKTPADEGEPLGTGRRDAIGTGPKSTGRRSDGGNNDEGDMGV